MWWTVYYILSCINQLHKNMFYFNFKIIFLTWKCSGQRYMLQTSLSVCSVLFLVQLFQSGWAAACCSIMGIYNYKYWQIIWNGKHLFVKAQNASSRKIETSIDFYLLQFYCEGIVM